MLKKKRYLFPILFIFAIWAWNSSLIAGTDPNSSAKLLSHRGVHQTYHRDGLTNTTCTAERIHPVSHNFIENTPESTQAAFKAGADVVEIDIHPTTDGKFVVFHDWTVDCRTQGKGVTREHSLAELQELDLGYGYTSDGGETFPLRGTYQGKMPELHSFLAAFSDKKFLINFKSNDKKEGEAFNAFLQMHPETKKQIFGVYGGAKPTNVAIAANDGMLGYTKNQTKNCLIQYFALGWSGYVPNDCQDKYIAVPANYAWMLWGWPNRVQKRMTDANSKIILLGPMDFSNPGSTGIDTVEQLHLVPDSFDGYVWTNKIEDIGPNFKQKN